MKSIYNYLQPLNGEHSDYYFNEGKKKDYQKPKTKPKQIRVLDASRGLT